MNHHPTATLAETKCPFSSMKLKRDDSISTMSTCASSADLDQYIRSNTETLVKTTKESDAPQVAPTEDPQPHEHRTFVQCCDLVSIYKCLREFDYSRIVLSNVITHLILHSLGGTGLYLICTKQVMMKTILFSLMCHVAAAVGITAGYHRLWSHKSYKASWPVENALLFLGTLACQNSCFEWARDHRVHHKYSETDADPHNANNGLFFAHFGWLIVKKHPSVKELGKDCSVNDLLKSRRIMFQHTYYVPLVILVAMVIPTAIPVLAWGEGVWQAYTVAITRILMTLHATWCVNSLAHWWGDTPYDATIFPVENYLVAWMTVGEGWHNYHHAFPNDYRCSDRTDPLWFRLIFNPTQVILDVLASVGLVKSRVTAPRKLVLSRMATHGFEALSKKRK